MKDDTRRNRNNGRKRPRDREFEDSLAQSMPYYTPEHRRAVLKGLRILARVAIRSYMEEKAEAEAASRTEAAEDGGEGVGRMRGGKEAGAAAPST